MYAAELASPFGDVEGDPARVHGRIEASGYEGVEHRHVGFGHAKSGEFGCADAEPIHIAADRLDGQSYSTGEEVGLPELASGPLTAIVGMGKRDAPYDEGLPVPLRVRRRDGTWAAAHGMRVTHLKDHHTYVELSGAAHVTPGELICFGISHPCTAFDKWQVIPVVEDDYTVTDLIHTYF